MILAERGWEVEPSDDRPWQRTDPDVVLVWGNANWFPRLFGSLIALPARERPVVAVFHFEPLPLPDGVGVPWNGLTMSERAKVVLHLPRATDPRTNWRRIRALKANGLPDVLAVSGRAGLRFLAQNGVEAIVAPLGWQPGIGRDLGRVRDVDVVFLGTLATARRRGVIRRLRREGVAIVHAGSYRRSGIWGVERDELLSRTRIVLNIARRPGEAAQARFVLGMSHGAAVVSEPIIDPAPFVPGEHYLSAPTKELGGAIQALLSDDERRCALAARGERFVLTELHLADSVDALIDAVACARAARPLR